MTRQQAVEALGLSWRVLKFIDSDPVVREALDNWANGESSDIDDKVWDIIERSAGEADERQVEVKTRAHLMDLQATYAEAESNGILDILKGNKRKWTKGNTNVIKGGNG